MDGERVFRSAIAVGVLTVVTLFLVAFAAKFPGRKSAITIGADGLTAVEISYEMTSSRHCWDCLSYAVRTQGRVVTFSCENCAVHEVRFVIDDAAAASLSEAFIQSPFFAVPRLNEGYPPREDPFTSYTWSYRDARQTHEVKALLPTSNPDLRRLRDRLLSIGRVDYFTKTPPSELIPELLKSGHWNPSPEGLAYLAGTHDYQGVRLLLDYPGSYVGGRAITDEVLEHAAVGGDLGIIQLIIGRLPAQERAAAAGRMLAIVNRISRPDSSGIAKWLQDTASR
jgi:hypothetical protein